MTWGTAVAVLYVGLHVAGSVAGCGFMIAVGLGALGRDALRKRLGLRGKVIEDVALHCCMHQCALCQEAREVQSSATQWGAGRRQAEVYTQAAMMPLTPVSAVGGSSSSGGVAPPILVVMQPAMETYQNPAGFMVEDGGLEQQFV